MIQPGVTWRRTTEGGATSRTSTRGLSMNHPRACWARASTWVSARWTLHWPPGSGMWYARPPAGDCGIPTSPSLQRTCRLPVTATARELGAWVRRAPNSTAATSLPGTGQPQFISQKLPVPAGLSAGACTSQTGPACTEAAIPGRAAQIDEPYG